MRLAIKRQRPLTVLAFCHPPCWQFVRQRPWLSRRCSRGRRTQVQQLASRAQVRACHHIATAFGKLTNETCNQMSAPNDSVAHMPSCAASSTTDSTTRPSRSSSRLLARSSSCSSELSIHWGQHRWCTLSAHTLRLAQRMISAIGVSLWRREVVRKRRGVLAQRAWRNPGHRWVGAWLIEARMGQCVVVKGDAAAAGGARSSCVDGTVLL